MRKLISSVLICLVIAIPAITPANETKDTAVAIVERLHSTLLSAMTEAAALGYSGRYDLLNPIVASSFDFSTIARIVTGRHWKDLSEDQKNAFMSTFTRLSTATYAKNFSGFSGERFETVGVEERGRNIVVKTVLVKSDGEEIELNYLLQNRDGVWRIVNVIAEGVSDLSLKRADYTAIIKNQGFDTLVAKLHGKIATLESDSN